VDVAITIMNTNRIMISKRSMFMAKVANTHHNLSRKIRKRNKMTRRIFQNNLNDLTISSH
jgi:hypothetical protein